MNNRELAEAIRREKQRTGTVILAHTYQSPEVLAVADLTGDSFALSRAAEKMDAERVLLCGVRFMAETVKILSPQKTVLLAHPAAGCPMARGVDAAALRAFRREHPDYAVCAYINTTTEVKTLADVCVTSSTALKIVSRMEEQNILFLPDKNLGAYIAAQVPQKNIALWEGCCPIHNPVRAKDLVRAKREHPRAKVVIHPECPPEAVALADFAGSTQAIIEYAKGCDEEILFVTERGVFDALSREYPDRGFYQLDPPDMTCPDMKLTTLREVYAALRGEGGEEITLREETRLAAKRCIDQMLRLGQ